MFSDMQIVFIILAATTISFAIPKFRSDLVALCSLLALFLTGVLSVPEALAGFSNTVVIMLAVLFIVGEGIAQTGLAKKAGNLLVKVTAGSEFRMLVFIKILVAVIGSFISNTGTVAILMPIVVSLSVKMNIHPGKLLMPLAFGASMGGALTLIGTAPNLLARDALINAGLPGLSFFDFTPIGLIIIVTGTLYMWFIGRKLLDKPYEKKSQIAASANVSELLYQYNIDEKLHYIEVPEGHKIVGKMLKDLKWPSLYNVTILKIGKKPTTKTFPFLSTGTITRVTPVPTCELEAGDTLLLYADETSIAKLLEEVNLEISLGGNIKALNIRDTDIAEVILTPQSSLVNKTIESVKFREQFGLTVLATKGRQGNSQKTSLQDKLQFGDAMLVYGKWKDIDTLAKERSNLVVITRQDTAPETDFNPVRAILAGAVLIAMVVMLVFEWIPAVMSIILAGLFMVLTGSVRSTEQAYRAINWQIIVLIACMMPMATALENTGGIAFIADSITGALGGAGPLVVMAGLYVTASLFGIFISNTATAVLFLPVAIMAAAEVGVSPLPFVMAVTYAASMSFATPVSTPPNAMVMVAGKYRFVDYMKVGIPLQILVGVLIIFLLPLFFPL